MRLLIHDFAGHPYAAQLSRSLADRGHDIVHGHCGGVTTGRGSLERRDGDPASLRFVDVSDRDFERYSPVRRVASEVRYGRRLADLVDELRPGAVVSANCPLAAQALLWRASTGVGARKVLWLQDFLGRGTRSVLQARSPVLGATFGAAWERLETSLLRRADHIVAITDDFAPELASRKVITPMTVIANWTPLDEVPPRPKATSWSTAHGLADRRVVLYAGTLGLKHDPEHLVAAARALAPQQVAVVVVTEGLGREHLAQRRAELGLRNLDLLDFVPWADVPDLLGAADALLVLLERSAGTFSAPSKVLTYLAAGRPIVGAIPKENLAARTVEQAGAGVIVEPGDHDAFAAAIASVVADPDAASAMGAAGRLYAEATFAIDQVSDAFEGVLASG